MEFKVVYSLAIQSHLMDLQAIANSQGRSKEFAKALVAINQRLATDPLMFGEPLYDLPDAKLRVRTAIILPLVVYWGVHQEENIIFIQEFKLV